MIKSGTWVEIEQTVLKPGERAENIPRDTKNTPLILLVSGFLFSDARIGGQAKVRTIIGRTLEGKLKRENPGYAHSFGATVPELLSIGTGAEE